MYFPYIFIDAMYTKVREYLHVVSKAVYIATAINENNEREIIGLKVNHSESHEAWKGFFQQFHSRGLQAPKLVISDAHKGLKRAIEEGLFGTAWQRCTVHFKRNIFEAYQRKISEKVKVGIKIIF